MKSGVILITTASLLVTGCATVDLQSMAGTMPASADAQPSERNVVQRAVDKLRAAFASRGFGEKTSQRKMHAAADMLLNGLAARSVSAPEGDYAATLKPASIVLDDIALAQSHIDQATRAAEIYLEMAPSERKLDDELDSLQAALMASERASRVFTDALGDETLSELVSLRTSVDALRTVTDSFGQRVRMSKSGKIGLTAASG